MHRRDLQQQAQSAQLVKQLRQHDRTTERSKMADNVFASPQLPPDPYDRVCCEHHGTDACCQGTGGPSVEVRRSSGYPELNSVLIP